MSATSPSCFMIWGGISLGGDEFGPRSGIRSAEETTCSEQREEYQDQPDPRYGLLWTVLSTAHKEGTAQPGYVLRPTLRH